MLLVPLSFPYTFLNFCLFIFGCADLLLLHGLFLVWQVRATLIAVCRLFTAVASLVAEHGLSGTWD